MEDDHQVWPPLSGPRHRRTPPEGTEPAPRDEEPPQGRAGRPEPPLGRAPYVPAQERPPEPGWGRPREPPGSRPPEPGWGRTPEPPGSDSPEPDWGRSPDSDWGRSPDPDKGRPPGWGRPPEQRPPEQRPGWGRRRHPLDLEPEQAGWSRPHPPDPGPEERAEASWNPRIRGTGPRDLDQGGYDDLPPSARLHGSPADPGSRGRSAAGGGGAWKRVAAVLAALAVGAGLVAGATVAVLRMTTPQAGTGRVSDSLAGVAATLPQGWSVGAVAPVTGFTSVVRNGDGALVMARPVPGPVKDARKATAEASELYSRLLLQGDRVTVVEDKDLPDGHTRALRAEYRDVVNRPAFLRVMLLTRGDRPVLLVGLLQPEENSGRQALDAVMTSLR
ncbi:hypothetical protein [Nonomuraea insulae]|uniref:DUF1795 domain-containing protein n=1 Tax=Nonomuraea insulae TaxID=1616787 RepID=A0ABW1D1C9_9ACTN